MRETLIHKASAGLRVAPNMADWGATRASFSWDSVREELGGAAGDFNIARLAVDRHALRGERANRVALRFLSPESAAQALSYADLQQLTNRFANGLRELGVRKGDRVFVLAGRIPDLYVAVLGSLKNGCVVTPLFSAFGPEPIATRIGIAQATVLVTTEALYRRKIEKIRAALPALRHVIVVGEGGTASTVPGGHDYTAFLSRAPDTPPEASTGAEDMALLHFTSGTTGTPKGAIHVHEAVADASRDRPLRARPASRRRLLVHGRPRLGDRHLLRHHRAAAARRDQHRRRGGVRRRALVPDPAGRRRSPSGTPRRPRSAC